MTVKDIVIEYLKTHDYDGLCSEDFRCSCGIDDLLSCDCEGVIYCIPAKKVIITSETYEKYHNLLDSNEPYYDDDEVLVPAEKVR